MLLALLTAGSPASGYEAQADPAVDFVVTPSRLEVRTRPGDTLEVPISVFNRAENELLLDTYIADIAIPPSDLLTVDELAFTASKWVRFTQPSLVLAGLAEETGTLHFAVPGDTPAGGYHAFAYFQSRPLESDTGVVPSGRIGVTLLLEVSPDGEPLSRAARVSATELSVGWSGLFNSRVEAATTVDNTGEAHVVVGGVHAYRAWPGAGSTTVKVGPTTTLRGTRQMFESQWDEVPLFGKVTVTSELVYQVSPDDLPVIVTQESVWIIPWRLIGVLALVAGLTAGALLERRRRRTMKGTPSET